MSSVEQLNPEPVEFVCMEAAFIGQGHIVEEDDGSLKVRLSDEPPGLRNGAQVILNRDGEAPRIIAAITKVLGREVIVAQKMVRAREKRSYPRLMAGLPIQYRVVSGPVSASGITRWVEGQDEGLSSGTWHSPDELMNSSVTGLRFDAVELVDEGALVLLQIELEGAVFRATARVVRVFDLEDGVQLAVVFEEIAAGAQEALSELTLRLQDALI